MGIKQLYNDNLRKLPNEYGDVSIMRNLASFFMYYAFCRFRCCMPIMYGIFSSGTLIASYRRLLAGVIITL